MAEGHRRYQGWPRVPGIEPPDINDEVIKRARTDCGKSERRPQTILKTTKDAASANKSAVCYKCGKTRHYAWECRGKVSHTKGIKNDDKGGKGKSG